MIVYMALLIGLIVIIALANLPQSRARLSAAE